MTDQEIAELINKILVDEFEINEAELTPDATLYEKLGLDSLDSVDLVVSLEKAFSFKMNRATDEEKIRAIRTVQDIYNFIKEKI